MKKPLDGAELNKLFTLTIIHMYLDKSTKFQVFIFLIYLEFSHTNKHERKNLNLVHFNLFLDITMRL